MKMKKIFAAMAATAVSAASFAVMAVPTASAADVVAEATLCGQAGTYNYWGADKNSGTVTSKSAEIDGNAQYEVTWDITGDGTGSIEFLILQIKGIGTTEDNTNFTSDQYPDLSVTIDDIIIDGQSVDYSDNAGAYQLNWYEGTGHVRVFLQDTWNVNGAGNFGLDTAITQSVKVKFTVGGLYNDGTSNVTSDETSGGDTTDSTEATTNADSDTETTTAASDDTTKDDSKTTTAAASDDNTKDDTKSTTSSKSSSGSSSNSSSKSSSNGGVTETSADTGDAGVAVAVAALALAGTAAVVSRKRK